MPLSIPSDTVCYIDANILYYAFVETPPFSAVCRELLARVQSGDLEGVTDVRALADALHKTMLAEVSARHHLPRGKLVGWLKRHREALTQLPQSEAVAHRLRRLRLRVLAVPGDILPEAMVIAQQSRLLTNDAIMVAMMRRNQITRLATNDDDFDGLGEIQVWKPR